MERHSSPTDAVAEASEVEPCHEGEAVSLKEAALQLGVSRSRLKRMIKGGELPEALKARTADGRIWVVPTEALADIAARQQGELLLDDETDGFEIIAVDDAGRATIRPEVPLEPQNTDLLIQKGAPSFVEALDTALLDRLLGVQEQAVLAVAGAERAEADLKQVALQQHEVTVALKVARKQRSDLEERFHTERLARVTAESRAAELELRVEREEALAREERAAANYANTRLLRREREAALATANLGWRARRRYRRQLSMETPA